MNGPYYIPATGTYVRSYFELLEMFPNSSLPQNVDIPDLGVYILQLTIQPEYDPSSQYVNNGIPEFRSDGRYYQIWDIINFELTEDSTDDGSD